MAIVKLKPAFKDYLWGGNKLKKDFHKETDLDIVAESWELSTHKDGQSVVVTGPHAGKTLTEYLEAVGKDALGTKGNAFEFFPILIKFIDAKGNLSIQVHPDNEYALRVEKEYGKTEMWYILDCEEGASLYYGTNQEISKEEFRERIENNTVLDVLKKVPVHKGDVFFIASGTIHAIGEGIVICEIQQNSNTTYRVYDFGRVGADGKPRQLHIDKAIEVSNLSPLPDNFKPQGELEVNKGYTRALMASCEYFTTYIYEVEDECTINVDDESFASIVIVDGEEAVVESSDTMLGVCKGDSIFADANTGKVTVKGKCKFILSRV